MEGSVTEFLQVALSWPTLLYTIGVGVCLVYWALMAIGLVDIDILPGDHMHFGHDVAGHTDGHVDMGLLSRIGLGGVPTTLVITLLVFFAWIISFFVQLLVLQPLAGWLRLLLGAGLALLVLVPSVLISAAVLRPVRRFLLKLRPADAVSILGKSARIRTPRVDAGTGMADVDDGGAGLILQVRADPALGITRGDVVVLVEHNVHDNTWRVIPQGDYIG